jgi:hypothetical protein
MDAVNRFIYAKKRLIPSSSWIKAAEYTWIIKLTKLTMKMKTTVNESIRNENIALKPGTDIHVHRS